MRQVNGMDTGKQDCPMGTRMKATTNTGKDMARSEQVPSGARFLQLIFWW